MHKTRLTIVLATVILFIICSFAVWLWNWRSPVPDQRLFSPVKISLQQAMRKTMVLNKYPSLTDTSIQFGKPSRPPQLSSDRIISIVYKDMHEEWYPGNVVMFYARVSGSNDYGNVWVIENHMFFPHSVPYTPRPSVWDWRAWAHKVVMLRNAWKPKTATSYVFLDANTGGFRGEVRNESF